MLRRHLLTTVASLSLLAASCGGGGGDQTKKFVGAWTFQSGDLTPVCPGLTIPAFQLTGLPVTFAKVDDSTISLTVNTGCVLKFHVSGNQGTALPKQTCALDVGGTLGMQSIAITAWTLSLSGDRIDNTISGSALICTATGTGVLVRGAPDGGAPDAGGHDGGGHDGGSDASGADGAASDGGGAADAASDGGGADAASADGGEDAPAADGATAG